MNHFYTAFTYGFASLFSMINPIGMSAVYLAMTKDYSDAKRHSTAYRVAIYGTVLLIITFFVGTDVLNFFGISLSSIQVAGGLLVFFSAWGMLATQPKISSDEAQKAVDRGEDKAFFPLTMPLTAGAGAMAVTMTLAARLSKAAEYNLYGIGGSVLAILLVFLLVGVCYRYADIIFKKLGYTGTNVVSKLTAFILLAIGVTVTWEGIVGLVTPLMQG